MNMNVNKNNLIQTLESILETRDGEDDTHKTASDMLLVVLRNPVECSTVSLSEGETLFLAENS